MKFKIVIEEEFELELLPKTTKDWCGTLKGQSHSAEFVIWIVGKPEMYYCLNHLPDKYFDFLFKHVNGENL